MALPVKRVSQARSFLTPLPWEQPEESRRAQLLREYSARFFQFLAMY